ncbi:MAG: chromate transporter [Solobacterium sp.]|nr:chromate transporter [Solobacterium sp.]
MAGELLDLYLLFFRMGAVTFGGGYAMLPILRREIVQKRRWMTEEEIIDYYAVSQGLPGIISVNVGVFIGHKQHKVPGALAAAFGVVSPCIIIISLIYFLLSSFQDNLYVRHALNAISVCVAALILDAVLSMAKKGIKDIFGIILCLAVLYLSLFTDVSPILIIIASGILGVIVQSLKAGAAKKGGQEK